MSQGYAGFLCISLGIVFWDVPRVPNFPPHFLDELVTRFCNQKFIHMWSRDDYLSRYAHVKRKSMYQLRESACEGVVNEQVLPGHPLNARFIHESVSGCAASPMTAYG